MHAERERLVQQLRFAARVVGLREAQILDQAPAHHVVAQVEAAREGLVDEQRVVVEGGLGRRWRRLRRGGEVEREQQTADDGEAQPGPGQDSPRGAYQIGDVQARSCTVRWCCGSQQPSSPSPIVSGSAQSTLAAAQMRWLQRQVGFSSTRA